MNQMKLTDIWKRLSGFKVNTAGWFFNKTTISLFVVAAIIAVSGWFSWFLYQNHKIVDHKYSEAVNHL